LRDGIHFGGQKQHLSKKTLLQCSQHCSHLGNDCPIIIVKGEVDGEYRSRVLAIVIYLPLQCTICGVQYNMRGIV
jgi:hypothetical protein